MAARNGVLASPFRATPIATRAARGRVLCHELVIRSLVASSGFANKLPFLMRLNDALVKPACLRSGSAPDIQVIIGTPKNFPCSRQ